MPPHQTLPNSTRCKNYLLIMTKMAAPKRLLNCQGSHEKTTVCGNGTAQDLKTDTTTLLKVYLRLRNHPMLLHFWNKTRVCIPRYVTCCTDTYNSLQTLPNKRLVDEQHHLQQGETIVVMLKVIPQGAKRKKKNALSFPNVYCHLRCL